VSRVVRARWFARRNSIFKAIIAVPNTGGNKRVSFGCVTRLANLSASKVSTENTASTTRGSRTALRSINDNNYIVLHYRKDFFAAQRFFDNFLADYYL